MTNTPPGAAPLPTRADQDPNPAERASALELRRDNYRFVHDWPEGVATSSWLPDEQDYSTAYIASSMPIYTKIAANYLRLALKLRVGPPERGSLEHVLAMATGDISAFKSHNLKAAGNPIKHLGDTARPADWRDYADIFQTMETPALVKLVNDDATLSDAMAWQRIGGCNPTVLARCTRVPSHFPVTRAHYEAAMGAGDSLEAALAEGRLYLADYAVLDGARCGVTDGVQKYVAAPLALYAAEKGTGRLRSVCIQNGQDPSIYPIVTPRDAWHWRMANQCVQVADANHHESTAHLGRTHFVMEVATLAMKRELGPTHPVAVLLEPHTATTMAINASAKTSLIAPGGTVDQAFVAPIRGFGDIVRRALQSYPISAATPRDDLAARGLLDADVLPVHPYRDDALPVWDALAAYIDEYVALYYAADAEVGADAELQAFVRALGSTEGGRLAGVPEVRTVAALARLLTTLVFIATAQHSAVNYSQYPCMGYVANMGGALYAPPPTASTPNTEEAFAALLAPMKIVIGSVTMVYLLSSVRDSTLGHYAPNAFSDPRMVPVVTRFNARLREVERESTARDATRYLSYPYLHPSQILQSISI